MSIHSGHRERVKERFLKDGLDAFHEHEVLEMLLFHCVARKDTNDLAHRLICEFGSFNQVMEATPEELQRVTGIGKSVATSLSFFSSFARYYAVKQAEDNGTILRTINECGEYLKPHFFGRRNEVVYLVCLDAKCKVLTCKMVGEGSVNSAGVPIRRIVEMALAANATSVILAHNHPSGIAVPSGHDVQTTITVAKALQPVDVVLVDHLVFSNSDWVSMVHSNYYKPEDIR